MISRGEVETTFADLLDQMQDAALRNKVLDVWEAIGEEALWPSLAAARFGAVAPTIPLIHHIRSVTSLLLAIAELRAQIYGEAMDRDILIAAGLLHDAGKVLEFLPDGPGVKAASSHVSTKHWYIGAYWAQRNGLPEPIIDMIMNHSNQNELAPNSTEALALYLADLVDADLIRWSMRAPLLTSPLKKK